MPTWSVKWKASGETTVQADRATAAETEVIDMLNSMDADADDITIESVELVDGDAPGDLSASLKLMGREIPVVYRQARDDEPEMPLFFRMPGYWTNGHVVLALDEDPPMELRGTRDLTMSLDDALSHVGQETDRPLTIKTASRYIRFLPTGEDFTRKLLALEGKDWASAAVYYRDGQVVTVILCENPGAPW